MPASILVRPRRSWAAPCLAALLLLAFGAAAPPRATAQSDNPAPDWGAPYCGRQPRINAVYDNDLPTYTANGRTVLYSGLDVEARCGMAYDGHSGFDYGRRYGGQACVAGAFAGIGARLVYAAADGVVRRSRWYGADHESDFGLHLDVASDGGPVGGTLSHLYGHLAAVFVEEGEEVVRGQAVGAVGTTGGSTGPHLHFQVARGPRGDVSDLTLDPYGWNAAYGPGYRYPGYAQPHRGDAWPARLLTPGQEGPRCPSECGAIVVEDDAPTVLYGCRAGTGLARCPSWFADGRGHGRGHHWTYPNGSAMDYWVRYACPQCAPGSYRIEAYVPLGRAIANTHVARYETGRRVTILDQHEEGDIWQPIGLFQFGGIPSITLTDRSDRYDYVARAPLKIAADAIRFVPLCDAGSVDPPPGGRGERAPRDARDAS